MDAIEARSDEQQAEDAHAAIGGFLARCSVLDYRAGQLIARYFCTGEKQKQLSYVLHSLDFDQKRQIVEERLTAYHAAPDALRATMAEAQAVIERRNLVSHGLLATRSGGGHCIKSYAGARFLTGQGEQDIIDTATLGEWSQRATQLADRLVKLGDQLTVSG